MKEYQEWINQADKDLDTAKYNLKGKKTEAGFFFLQQSAEKALKAVYIKKFKELIKTHDLFLLAKKLKAPKEILEYCKKLGPAYQYTRYPDASQPEKLDILEGDFVFYSEQIIKWCKENL